MKKSISLLSLALAALLLFFGCRSGAETGNTEKGGETKEIYKMDFSNAAMPTAPAGRMPTMKRSARATPGSVKRCGWNMIPKRSA